MERLRRNGRPTSFASNDTLPKPSLLSKKRSSPLAQPHKPHPRIRIINAPTPTPTPTTSAHVLASTSATSKLESACQTYRFANSPRYVTSTRAALAIVVPGKKSTSALNASTTIYPTPPHASAQEFESVRWGGATEGGREPLRGRHTDVGRDLDVPASDLRVDRSITHTKSGSLLSLRRPSGTKIRYGVRRSYGEGAPPDSRS